MSSDIISLICNCKPVCTYDDWVALENEYNGEYYIYDIDENRMYNADLVVKKPSKEFDNIDIVDFGSDYDGQSDDFKYYMGFNIGEEIK